MKSISKYTHIVLVATLCCCLCGELQAAMAPEEKILFDLMNETRINPLAVAESYGMDREALLKSLPSLSITLKKGLPRLWHNENLQAAAMSHSKDMILRSYYSHETPEGITYQQRIETASYPAAKSGETIGILAFYNYMDLEDAVKTIFGNLLKDELDPNQEVERHILSNNFHEVGISVETGTLVFGKITYNIVVVTCDFGLQKTKENGNFAFYQLINQARKNPLAYAASLGMDRATLIENFPQWDEMFSNGLPPVGMSDTLSWTSGIHTIDMIINQFYDTFSSSGHSYDDRLDMMDYPRKSAVEGLSHYVVDHYVAPEIVVKEMFDEMFRNELDPDYPFDRIILNPNFSEAGVGFGLGSINVDGTMRNAYLLTCDTAEPIMEVSPRYYLTGRVFSDKDGDGLYSPGEGLAGVEILVEIWDLPFWDYSTTIVRTGKSGEINVKLAPSYVRASSLDENIVFQSGFLPLNRKNQQIIIAVPPPEVEAPVKDGGS